MSKSPSLANITNLHSLSSKYGSMPSLEEVEYAVDLSTPKTPKTPKTPPTPPTYYQHVHPDIFQSPDIPGSFEERTGNERMYRTSREEYERYGRYLSQPPSLVDTLVPTGYIAREWADWDPTVKGKVDTSLGTFEKGPKPKQGRWSKKRWLLYLLAQSRKWNTKTLDPNYKQQGFTFPKPPTYKYQREIVGAGKRKRRQSSTRRNTRKRKTSRIRRSRRRKWTHI